MKRINFLFSCLIAVALLTGASMALAQAQASEQPDRIRAVEAFNFNRFFLFYSEENDDEYLWWDNHTVVDATGGVHSVFYTSEFIHYAYCATNCNNPANWRQLPLFATGTYDSLVEPTLATDAAGHPRLIWYAQYDGETGSYYYYAECNTNCTANVANWSSGAIGAVYDYPQKFVTPHSMHRAARAWYTSWQAPRIMALTSCLVIALAPMRTTGKPPP